VRRAPSTNPPGQRALPNANSRTIQSPTLTRPSRRRGEFRPQTETACSWLLCANHRISPRLQTKSPSTQSQYRSLYNRLRSLSSQGAVHLLERYNYPHDKTLLMTACFQQSLCKLSYRNTFIPQLHQRWKQSKYVEGHQQAYLLPRSSTYYAREG
jgi:hypothetical protein